MNVVHLVAPAMYGGLEQVVATLAAAQQRRGSQTHAIVLGAEGEPEPPLADALRNAAVNVVGVRTHARAYRRQLELVRDTCERLHASVLHSHGYHPDVLAALLGRATTTARVSTVHGFTGGDARNRFYEWLQCRAYRRFDAVVAVSRKLEDDLERRGVPAERLHVLPNAWNADADIVPRTEARRSLGVPVDVFSIGWVGRVTREKGLDLLIDALPRLQDFPIHLTIVGDGAERSSVMANAERLNVASRISWAGAIPDASRLLWAFDLLVLSSRTEGTPMVLLEAMSALVPVLVTNVGGIPDVVSPAEAVLVPPEDPAALAAGIRAVQLDRDGAAERARRARERLDAKFAVDPWVDAQDVIYQSALQRARQRAR